MRYYIHRVIKKDLFQVFMGSAISTGVKVLATVVLSKIIAERLGPSGLGLIGQLSSFVSITLLLASGGYQNGIVKFAALYKSNAQLTEFVRPSLKLTSIIAVISGVLLFLLSGFFSNLVFHSQQYVYIFYWLALTIVLYSFNNYFNAFLNGISDFKSFNILNICNSIFSVAVSVLLIYWFGIKGALLAVVLSQTLTSVAAIPLIIKYKEYFIHFYRASISQELLNKLFPYIKMTLFSLVLLPASQIIVRNIIKSNHGDFQMGIWEAVNRISGLYMLVITNVMLIYYLPRLAVTKTKPEIFREFKKGAIFFGTIILCISLGIFLFRGIIIKLFLSSQFMPVSDLVLLQAVGDMLKVIYYLLAYFAIARSLTLYYILTEALFFIIYISVSYFLVPGFGTRGAVCAYVIMNFCALVAHALFIGKLYFSYRNKFATFLFGRE